MEVYVDDMLIKSKKGANHISNLGKTFQILQHYKMKLNVTKCTFGVCSGEFPGFKVNHRGIKAKPEKIQALQNLQRSTNLKELHKLTSMIATLNKFTSKCFDMC